jgi:hypothetical protein
MKSQATTLNPALKVGGASPTWNEAEGRGTTPWLDLGERRMETGKRSATPMTIQPYRGVDQQPMSTTPSKLSKKAERSVAEAPGDGSGDGGVAVALAQNPN